MQHEADESVTEYRGHRIRAIRHPDGWVVRVCAAGRRGVLVLRNHVPLGCAVLVGEARRRIDRLLDGAPWQRAP